MVLSAFLHPEISEEARCNPAYMAGALLVARWMLMTTNRAKNG